MSTVQPLPPTVEALLSDGTTAAIRPLRPADREAAYDLHAVRMSEKSRRQRFFGASRLAPKLAADRLCEPRPGFMALGAWVDRELVGAADYEIVRERPDAAEIALAVADRWQHHGVATLLLEHLLHAAREQGVRTIEADTLAGNRAVHQVFADLGLRVHRRLDHGEIRVRVPLDETDEHYRSAVEERGRSADVASLVPLLRPRSVAVVGASQRPGSVGRTVLEKIRQGGFRGELWAVNPHARQIADEPAYPALSALPGTPDLAVLAVPPGAVANAAEECGRAGVRALVVLASGLSGADARQLLAACRRHSMRLVGPNCLGIAVTDDAVRLDAEFGAAQPLSGTAGVAVQSGGVGIALLERLNWLGIGVSDFVSLGDKYDVSGNDLLQWWESDSRTDLALLHLESFGNPRAFSRTARRVTRRFPILTVDAGRSAAGRRGVAAHTAAGATPTVTRTALFRQAGITATHGIAELVEAAALLHAQPLPDARSAVAVVSNAAGMGILAADACMDFGLVLPELPAHLALELTGVLPAGASAANPVDTGAAVGPTELRSCLDLLTRSRAVEAVLVCLVPTALATDRAQDPLRALLDGPGRRRIPVAAVLLDQQVPVRYLDCADGARIPVYADPQAAARALAHARDRARWLAEPPGAETAVHDCDQQTAKDLVARFLDAHPDGGRLDPALTEDLLRCYGLPLTTSIWAPDEHGTVLAARSMRQLGHEDKIALKAYWPGQVRKSDAGAVYLGPGDDASVRTAYQDFENRFGERLAGVVVQPMAAPGTELFAGVVQDQVFGPLIAFGMGGTTTDLLDDRTARLTPLTENDLHTMTTELRCAPVLFGYHGRAAADLTAVQDMLARLSRLADDLPQLAEADLNPVIATPDGLLCVDARVRLEPRHPFDPYLRRLRQPAAS
ncbi:bifunctional acetate--CoA ligase family protein/GNAT family N-acetyltransferase [Kitasatospora mediocidica]|uniref:bifunctional acetate--CoA ligase family protein/GNAT family N-acetyltransferase n=1 Tax=Kitasatospora mediocidica TaxID=58352 RepID=UPI000561406F|nr:bifunctional GNAT family N-acetyltransferase/acetate--CoA ligase family protein [Kitasatospora mediocidica]